MTEEVTQDRKHYYLVAGNIVIQDPNGGIQAIPQNATLVCDSQNLTAAQLGKAQQALQLTLFRKLGDLNAANVLDVLLVAFSYLGHMTEAEFTAVPEGVSVQEREKPSNVVNFTKEVKDHG